MSSKELQETVTESRYVVGIDLGTTNSAVCYVDTESKNHSPQVFPIGQFVGVDLFEARETLPSFHYQPRADEFPENSFTPPFGNSVTKTRKNNAASHNALLGTLARDQGAKNLGRLISSAKSWLSHSGVDRTAPLLPWGGSDEVEKYSPLEISAKYLHHIRLAWDAAHPQFPLHQQDIVLTLPASFDEVARELTIAAAKEAGIAKLVLLEEPQAAFYAWMARNETQSLKPGQKILVLDLGGGTTDLTLIRVRETDDGKLKFHRVAVGEHLILGGDNFDLALAQHLQHRLVQEGKIPKTEETEQGKNLPPRLRTVLVRQCCRLKELMLGPQPPETTSLTLPGLGSKLLGGSVQIEVTRKEVHELLVDGFFPFVSLDSKPVRHANAFREFGLPYASDAAITRHLARFLEVHRHSGDLEGETFSEGIDPARPDFVLFNGGVFESETLRKRVVAVIESWFANEGSEPYSPCVLENPRLDLSVALGAARYGMVRRGQGERISATLARSYYVGIENTVTENRDDETKSVTQAICLLPASVEADEQIVLTTPEFELLIGTPVAFPLYVSSLRLTDRPGEILEIAPEQIKALPPIKTVLKTRRKNQEMIRVRLRGMLTEIGTLELELEEIVDQRSGPRKGRKQLNWRLEFDIRSTTQTDRMEHESDSEKEGFFDESTWEDMKTLLERTFSVTNKNASPEIKPSELVKKLVEASELSREHWPGSLLRRIGQELMTLEQGRKISAAHESRWLNLLGYAYRPGFGLAMDDWRIDQFWKTVQGNLLHNTSSVRMQWWIVLRRIAGGLTTGQQLSVSEPILGHVRALHKQLIEGRGRGGDLELTSQEGAEIWRLLGAMELLPRELKTELGRMIIDLAFKKCMEPVYEAMIWALGRIGARTLLSGPLNAVLPVAVVEPWIRTLLQHGKSRSIEHFALLELARKTDDPYRDVSEKIRDGILAHFLKTAAPEHFSEHLRTTATLDEAEQGLVFGESLPLGLRIAGEG